MKSNTKFNIGLITGGIGALAYQGICYAFRDLQQPGHNYWWLAEKKEKISFLPIVGVLALSVGVSLMIAGKKDPTE